MQGFIMQLRRRPLVWCLLTLALALAMAVSLIGVSAWGTIGGQSDRISEEYVTIAVPLHNSKMSEGEILFDAAMSTGCVESVDNRCLLGAEVKGSRALTSGAIDRLDYLSSFDRSSYAQAVLTATCEAIEENQIYRRYEEEQGPMRDFELECTIEEVVSLVDAYEKPQRGDKIRINFSGGYNEDGSIPFEIGKTYIFFGDFDDYPVQYTYVEYEDPKTGEVSLHAGVQPDSSMGYSMFICDNRRWDKNAMTDQDWQEYQEVCRSIEERYPRDEYMQKDFMDRVERWSVWMTHVDEDGYFYYSYRLPGFGALPWWNECPGSAEEFLASDEGKVWREQILPLCEVNHHSASVILTDNLQSMYSFNNGVATIQEGRDFTAEDYKEGNDVCIIGADYAAYNNYRLGDKITLDYYNTIIDQEVVVAPSMAVGNMGDSERYWIAKHGVCTEKNRIGVCKEYEIVGIYSAPAFKTNSILSFQGDTIFVPKASVPDSEKYETCDYELLQSLILKNGTKDLFMQRLKEYEYTGDPVYLLIFDDPDNIDYSEYFMCFDQQYETAEGSVEVMGSNALRLLLLSLAGFAVVLAAVQYFSYRKLRQTALTMRRLGIDRRRIRKQAFAASLLSDGVALVLGALLAWLLFARVTALAEVEAVSLSAPVLLLSAVGLFAVSAAASALCAARLSRLPLMQKK